MKKKPADKNQKKIKKAIGTNREIKSLDEIFEEYKNTPLVFSSIWVRQKDSSEYVEHQLNEARHLIRKLEGTLVILNDSNFITNRKHDEILATILSSDEPNDCYLIEYYLSRKTGHLSYENLMAIKIQRSISPYEHQKKFPEKSPTSC